jgi:hypothetical protein
VSSPAAWHPDPTGRHEHRYWDGERWTEHVADAGVAAEDPLDTTAGGATADGTTEGYGPAGYGSTGEPHGSHFTDTPPIESASTPPPSSTPGPHTAPAASPGDFGYASGGRFPSAAPVDPGTPKGSNPVAIIAMVLGIVSIVLSWLAAVSVPAGGIMMILIAIAAVVLGAMGKSRANRGLSGNGMAITGIVTGVVGVIAAVFFLLIGWFVGEMGGFGRIVEEVEWMEECLEEHDQDYCEREFERRIFQRDR